MDIFLGIFFHQNKNEDLIDNFERAKDVFSFNNNRVLHEVDSKQGKLIANCSLEHGKNCFGIAGSNFINIDFKDDLIVVENDLYGMRPCFYLSTKEYTLFCSEIEPLLCFIEDEIVVNKSAINHYLKFGVSSPGETFARDINFLCGNTSLELSMSGMKVTQGNQKVYRVQSLDRESIWREIVSLLKDSTQKWIEKYNITHANLSGGSDTRLLLALLTDEQRQEFTFITDRSPYLDDNSDKDVIVAKLLAEKFSLRHLVREHILQEITDDHCFMRSDPVTIAKLSGNHGGEILGADVFGAMEFLRSEEENCDFTTDYQQKTEYMFNSFFTDIYAGGVFNHWTMPQRFSGRKCAPFWDQRLISFLSGLSRDDVSYYWAYAEVYRKHFPEFMKIPFHSPITLHHHDFEQLETGINQKESVPKKRGFELLNEEKSIIEAVGYFDFVKLCDSEISETEVMRSIKINRWLFFYVKEKRWLIRNIEK